MKQIVHIGSHLKATSSLVHNIASNNQVLKKLQEKKITKINLKITRAFVKCSNPVNS